MTPEKLDQILDKIDGAVGTPESESPAERAKREQYVADQARRREIRKKAQAVA